MHTAVLLIKLLKTKRAILTVKQELQYL